YLLIDRSNSMGYSSSNPSVQFGDKMEYAKRAAIAVLDQLGPSDLVATIAFDSQPYELGPLRPVAESRAALRAAIERIRYGGGTGRRIDPTAGLEDAAARVATPGSLLAGLAEAELPPVGRWAPTRLRPGAELRLYVDAGDRHDPLLATWQHELGRVAALPVDFE